MDGIYTWENLFKHHYLEIFFYSHLNMEHITDADYAYVKRVCKDFEINNLGEYHGLYAHSDTLMLDDVFQNFQNICVKTNKFHPAPFFTVPGLAW